MARRRLDAWKEIATYLGRDVTTVRRWERREGLPVHRHLHDKLGSVYAYADEIDEWMSRRSIRDTPASPIAIPTPQADAPEPTVPAAPGPTAPEPREAQRPAIEQPPIVALASVVTSRAPWRAMLVVAVILAVGMMRPWSPDNGEAVLLPDAGDDAFLRVALTPPSGTVVDSLALSPDAQQVLFCVADTGGTRIWVRRVDSVVAEPLGGTEGASFPFWSPDGQRFGFFAAGRLKMFHLATREVRDVAEAPEGHGGTWNDRDEILFAPNRGSALLLIHMPGGPLTQITTLGLSFKEGHAWPSFLPDGHHFFYTDYSVDQKRFGIYVGDLNTRHSKLILRQYSSAAYAAGGFVLFVQDGLMAQRFDPVRLELRGEAMPLAEQVLKRWELGAQADFSVSRTAGIVVRSAQREFNELQWIDRASGKSVGRVAGPAYYSNPTLSPNGRQLLATVTDDNSDTILWSFDVATGQPTRVSRDVGYSPVWSPNGAEILFASQRGLVRQQYGRSHEPVSALAARMWQVPGSWSTDGRNVTVTAMSNETKADIWYWRVGDHPHAIPLLRSPANEGQARISPDGRYLAYTSDESGRFEVYVQEFPVANGRWKISTGGGADPQWSRDRRELFYIAADRQMMAVPVQTESAFSAGTPTALFRTQLGDLWVGDTRNHYDVSPDGRRFVIIAPATDRREAPFTLLANWTRSLRR